MTKILFILAAVIIGSTQTQAHAGVVIDADILYLTDTFPYSSATSSYKRMLWDASLGFELTKKGAWVLGWNYGSKTFSDDQGTTKKLTISDMGPKLTYFLNKDQTWALSFTYNLISKGSYDSGSGAATSLRGTSMKGELAYIPMLTETMFLGFKINYYKAAFTEEVTGDTALAKVTDSRTSIYPSLAFIYRWE